MPSDTLSRPRGHWIAALSLAAMLSGCASSPAPRIDGLPDRVELTAVPFYRGSDNQGAPTALAALLRDRGFNVTPGLVTPYLQLQAKPAALDASIEEAARHYGLVVYPVGASFQGLLAQVAAGNPVLLRYREGSAFWSSDHYALLVGYDRFKRHLLLRVGEQRRAMMPFSDFVSAWQTAGQWAVLAQAPTQLPAQVDASAWRQAASRLAGAGQGSAADQALQALGSAH